MKTIILLVSTLILSTCSNSKNKMDITALFEKEWKVILLNETDVSDLNLTMMFQDNDKTVNGFGGCNTYFGNYALDINDISFTKVSATKMYCKDPKINKNEALFLSSLSKVKRFKPLEDNTIQFLDETDQVLITLKP